jgi:hypothetical protein
LDPDEELLANLIPESKCTLKREDRFFLRKILGNKNFITSLLFRGSRDGFRFAKFHTLCDLKSDTITLLKLKENGICIGGYTRA